MHLFRVAFAPLLIAAAAVLLAACGGYGGGGGDNPSAPVNKPFARERHLVTSPSVPVTGQLYASVIGNTALTFHLKAKPGHGTASIDKNTGLVTYSPDANFTGNDSLTYVAASPDATSPLAEVTILVNPDPPKVSAFGAPVYVHDGGPTQVALKVRLSNPPNGQATVNYTTGDGTALAGTDYTAVNGTLNFGPGVLSRTVTIPLSGAAHTVSRYFFLKLSNPSSNLTMGRNVAAVILRYFPTPLNDTGVRGCATTTNGNPSNPNSCPQAGYPVQDAEIGRDAAAVAGTLVKVGSGIFGYDFTAIGNDGKPLFDQQLNRTSYSLHPWACLRDNWTGLMWEVPTPVAGAGLYDTSYLYTWYNPDSDTNGGDSGTPNGGFFFNLDTYHFVQAANEAELCGYSDWRLPTAAELRNLFNIGAPGTPNGPLPAIPTLEPAGYWTATPDPKLVGRATVLSSQFGYDSFLPEDQWFSVLLVRGGSP